MRSSHQFHAWGATACTSPLLSQPPSFPPSLPSPLPAYPYVAFNLAKAAISFALRSTFSFAFFLPKSSKPSSPTSTAWEMAPRSCRSRKPPPKPSLASPDPAIVGFFPPHMLQNSLLSQFTLPQEGQFQSEDLKRPG